MIFGNCPYCDEGVSIGIPDGTKLPALALLQCEHCHKEYYEKMSRLDPEAYKKEDVVVKGSKVISINGVSV